MPHECTSCRRVFPDGSKEMLSGCPDCGGNKFQFRPSGTVPDDGAGGAEGEATAEPPEPPEPQSPGGVAETVAGATERVRSLVGSDADDGAAADDHEWPAVGREDGPRSAADDDGAIHAETAGSEDSAQASARSGVVDRDELPDHTTGPATEDDATAAADTAATDGAGAEPAGSDAAASTSPDAPPSPDTEPSGPGPAPDAGRRADAGAGPGGDAADEPDSAPFTGSGDRDDSPDLAELREELNDQFESIKIVDRGQYELNLMELYDREEYIISLLEDGRYAIEVPETWRDD